MLYSSERRRNSLGSPRAALRKSALLLGKIIIVLKLMGLSRNSGTLGKIVLCYKSFISCGKSESKKIIRYSLLEI